MVRVGRYFIYVGSLDFAIMHLYYILLRLYLVNKGININNANNNGLNDTTNNINFGGGLFLLNLLKLNKNFFLMIFTLS